MVKQTIAAFLAGAVGGLVTLVVYRVGHLVYQLPITVLTMTVVAVLFLLIFALWWWTIYEAVYMLIMYLTGGGE